MRQVLLGLRRMPPFQPQELSQSLLRKALAMSTILPLNGLVPDPVGARLRDRTMCDRRYSAPNPRATRPSPLCQARAGSIEIVLMFASFEMNRPGYGSAQFVRRPNGVNTPRPTVRF